MLMGSPGFINNFIGDLSEYPDHFPVGKEIYGWIPFGKVKGSNLGKENIDRVMNNARWLINEISSRLNQ